MYHLLLVDDEPAVADNLAVSIDWEALGIAAVHKAYSGTEALAVLEREAIDILVTDIRMPGMSGLELIARIGRRRKRIRCVLLTGYSEFDYAKQAIRLGTADYLLKPLRNDDLVATVRRQIEALDAEWSDIASRERAERVRRDSLPLLRRDVLLGLLSSRNVPHERLRERLEAAELGLAPGEACTLLLVRVEEGFRNYESLQHPLLEFGLCNIAEELFADSFRLLHCRDEHDYLVFLLMPLDGAERAPGSEADARETEEGARDTEGRAPKAAAGARGTDAHTPDTQFAAGTGMQANRPGDSPGGASDSRHQARLENIAAQLQESVRQYLNGRISVVVSRPGRFPEELHARYQSAIGLLRRRIGSQTGFFLTDSGGEDPAPGDETLPVLHSLYEPPSLHHLLEAGRWDEALRKLEAAFAELHARSYVSQEHLLEVYYYVSHALIQLSHKNNRLLQDILQRGMPAAAGTQPFQSLDQLRAWCRAALERVREDTRSEARGSRAGIIQRVQAFVLQGLERELSLQTIADHVYLHPVYLSKVYKLETGESLSDYLLRLRMERAAALLGDPALRIHEIAGRLDYATPSYFIKVFKKYHGLTPQEFRNRG
ncbi:response regulator [Paenibacillus sp. IB182496]|uniref:Response regulator n=1 Tax=Paenibacillus sabuli TaxID=2772509 RepID=A0A927GTW4_9BACL|nr:response regulator [Paenibacillus sabuli]MBD2848043.1 response regulator [Paenibacillus sabuli]